MVSDFAAPETTQRIEIPRARSRCTTCAIKKWRRVPWRRGVKVGEHGQSTGSRTQSWGVEQLECVIHRSVRSPLVSASRHDDNNNVSEDNLSNLVVVVRVDVPVDGVARLDDVGKESLVGVVDGLDVGKPAFGKLVPVERGSRRRSEHLDAENFAIPPAASRRQQ